MDTIRLGLIGAGSMGLFHARYLQQGKIRHARLAAVADADPARLQGWGEVATFADGHDLIRSGLVDAVLIATPHFQHTTYGMAALQQGLHVLVEKPISVHKADAERLIAAHQDPSRVFAAMFMMRTEPHYRKIRQLVQGGELGEIRRVNWIITEWFRTDAYYRSGGWRATWRGEGGGVLLNQCPHNLDLLQWIAGMPSRLRAFCAFGKYHDIEVEDEVTAYLEYPNGATGVFVTTTGEAPGTNRLEIAGTRGKLVYEEGKLAFVRNEVACDEFCRTCTEPFARPEVWRVEIPVAAQTTQPHEELTQNFVDAILEGAPLIAPAEEGLYSVELANAMLYSAWTDATVTLPLDGAAYERLLQERIATSCYQGKAAGSTPAKDMGASFAKA